MHGRCLRCKAIKGQQQKVMPSLFIKKDTITMATISCANIDNRCRYQYNYIVDLYPHIKTE